MGQDRADVQFAAKDISRFMSKPKEQDWKSAKRLARYLKDNMRMVIECHFQRMPEKVVVWSDTEFAGRERAGRSISGGMGMFGTRCIKTHSQMQETNCFVV